MAEILLIRHGQASFGSDNYDQLSELGYHQARMMGHYFLSQETTFSSLYAGGLQRQQQTAQGLIDVYRQAGVAVPELTIDKRWDELENDRQVEVLLPALIASKPELAALKDTIFQDKKAFQKVLRAVFNHWIIDQPDTTELESWPQAEARYGDALARVRTENGSGTRAAVFTSGGVIAAVTAMVMKLGPEHVYGLFEPVINASISRYIHAGDKISLSSFNEHTYLNSAEILAAEFHSDKTRPQESIISYR